MYAELSQISLLSVSNSELFLVKDEEERIEFDILKRTPLEFQEEYGEATVTCSSHYIPDDERQVLEDHEEKKEQQRQVTATSKKKISLGEFKAMEDDDDDDDDDDGFKTPTSLDHKIPVIKQCPPAPRKPKPLQSNKRKASPSRSAASTRGNLQLNLSQEVESLFSAPLLVGLHRKVKKARTLENQ